MKKKPAVMDKPKRKFYMCELCPVIFYRIKGQTNWCDKCTRIIREMNKNSL